jgi:hypothetical protein
MNEEKSATGGDPAEEAAREKERKKKKDAEEKADREAELLAENNDLKSQLIDLRAENAELKNKKESDEPPKPPNGSEKKKASDWMIEF